MEKEDLSDFASDPKPLPQDVEMVSRLNPSVLYNALGSAFILWLYVVLMQKMRILVKNEEKVEKYVEEAVVEKVDEKKMETSKEKFNENPNQDSDSKLQHQGQKQQPKDVVLNSEKIGNSTPKFGLVYPAEWICLIALKVDT